MECGLRRIISFKYPAAAAQRAKGFTLSASVAEKPAVPPCPFWGREAG